MRRLKRADVRPKRLADKPLIGLRTIVKEFLKGST